MSDCHRTICQISEQIDHYVVGQPHVTRAMLIALLTGGHVLIEGLPGTAKTRAVKVMSQLMGLSFARVQFTPDLLPADITGSQIYQHETSELNFQPGPIFHSMILADEINRAPAKVQAALLEGMAEGTVSTSGTTMPLPQPFMVLATQNPVEQEGTYPLPEAQLDRFVIKVTVDYPELEHEKQIIRLMRQEDRQSQSSQDLGAVPDASLALERAKQAVLHVHVAESMEQYMADLVVATRTSPKFTQWIEVGASPRASIALDRCSRAQAWLEGRDFVMPDDIRTVATSVLAHRITLTFDALSEGITSQDVIEDLLLHIPFS